MSDDTLFDAVLSAGEVSPEGTEFLGNNARAISVPVSNLTYRQFIAWAYSPERVERCREMYERGERILGPERWAKFRVRVFVAIHKPGEPVSISQESDLRYCFTSAPGESPELTVQDVQYIHTSERGANGGIQAV